jgi:hypothetical protein
MEEREMKRRSIELLLFVGFTAGLCQAALEPAKADAPASGFFQVDLSRHANRKLTEPLLSPGNNLAELAEGLSKDNPVKTLKDVPFRLDGTVMVGPGETVSLLAGGPVKLDRKVEGIPIGRKAERLYFLHGTNFSAEMGARIGTYILHYADGSTAEMPIRYGIDLADWWAYPDKEAPESLIVWTGNNEAAKRYGAELGMSLSIRLFMKVWDNPHPDREIKSLDMVTGDQESGQAAPAPFLVALTGAAPPAR